MQTETAPERHTSPSLSRVHERARRPRSLALQASVLCGVLWAASSLACNEDDRTRVTPDSPGGAAGNATAGGGSGGAGATTDSGAPAAGGASGQPNGGAGPDSGAPCVGNPSVSFIEAQAICGGDCLICAVDIAGSQPVGYFTLFGDGCACPSPAPRAELDAGVSGLPPTCAPRGGFLTEEQALSSCAGEGGDAGACRVCREDDSDAGAARSWSVTRAECECPSVLGHECGSYPNLTEAEASTLCAGLPDCHVCVQQTDPAGAPELWLAHACGCPAPYRRTE